MSETQISVPPPKKLLITNDGVGRWKSHIESVNVFPADNGGRLLSVQNGNHMLQFVLDAEQSAHLANLLST